MRTTTRIASGAFVGLGICALAFACGKSSPSPSDPPTDTHIITIMPGGIVNPKAIVVPRGSQVTFVNNDSRTHDMSSDPHPDHTDCPELDTVAVLRSGESRQSKNLNLAMTCGYHDHLNFEMESLRGTIVIQ